tara:strand:- start:5200 stop:5373 length:174 start_codon:yes stop_codon:yes gene_type:complete
MIDIFVAGSVALAATGVAYFVAYQMGYDRGYEHGVITGVLAYHDQIMTAEETGDDEA